MNYVSIIWAHQLTDWEFGPLINYLGILRFHFDGVGFGFGCKMCLSGAFMLCTLRLTLGFLYLFDQNMIFNFIKIGQTDKFQLKLIFYFEI